MQLLEEMLDMQGYLVLLVPTSSYYSIRIVSHLLLFWPDENLPCWDSFLLCTEHVVSHLTIRISVLTFLSLGGMVFGWGVVAEV